MGGQSGGASLGSRDQVEKANTLAMVQRLPVCRGLGAFLVSSLPGSFPPCRLRQASIPVTPRGADG